MKNSVRFLSTASLVVVAVFLWSMAWPVSPATSGDYKPFDELPQDFVEFLKEQGFENVEFVVIATSNEITSFRLGEAKENEIDEAALQEGEFVVPGVFGFDFAQQPEGFHVVVVSTASPGSGNDCRRGGSCVETNK